MSFQQTSQTPGTANKGAGRFHPLAAALVGLVAVLCCIYAINPRFFFTDDRQVQYFPYGLIIKQALLDGHFPFLTVRTFTGGALWLDWQYGLLNPFSLLLTLTIMPQHLELSGLLFAILVSGFLCCGVYRLGRAYALRADFSALLAFLMGTNIYSLYFDSNIWGPALLSLAFLAFAWASLKELPRRQGNIPLHVLTTGVLMYLTVSAGWPHTDVVLAIVGTVLFAAEVMRGNRQGALRFALAAGLSVALCLPVVVPVVAALPWTARVENIDINGLTASVPDLLAGAGNPGWPTMVSDRDQTMSLVAMPFYFIAWFFLPAMFMARRSALSFKKIDELAAVAAPLFLLATGMLHIHLLRYPTRWLADLDLVILIVTLSMLQDDPVLSAPRPRHAVVAMIMLALLALGNPAQPVLPSLILFPMPIIFALLLPLAARAAGGKWLASYLGAGAAAIVLSIAAMFPVNPILYGDWGKDDQTTNIRPHDGSCVNYSLYLYDFPASHRLLDENEFLYQAMGAYFNIDTIGGYSSLGHRSWARVSGNLDNFASAKFPALMRHEPETGASYLELLKVGTIVADKKTADSIAPGMSALHWTQENHPATVRFMAPQASRLPGTVSWHSPALTVGDGALETNGESLTLRNGPAKATIAFARAFYPGFHADLDGVPLTTRALDDFFVAVDIPPNAAGRLELGFLPPYFEPCMALAITALLAAAAAALWNRQRAGKVSG